MRSNEAICLINLFSSIIFKTRPTVHESAQRNKKTSCITNINKDRCQVTKVLQGFTSIPVIKNEFAPFSGTHSRLIYYSKFPQKAVIDEPKFYSTSWRPFAYAHDAALDDFFTCCSSQKAFSAQLLYTISIKVL